MVIYMKNIFLYLLISLQVFLIVFFILSFNHLYKLDQEEKKYQRSYVDYEENLKKEEETKNKLNEKINNLNTELNNKQELNKNLNSVLDMNKKRKQSLEERINK